MVSGKPGAIHYVPGDNSVIAFTQFGIENLQELIEMKRRQTR